MKLSTTNASFSLFLDLISKTLNKNFDFSNYFNLSQERKSSVKSNTLKLIKNLINNKLPLNDDNDFVDFIKELIKRNDTTENYELNGVLKDILENPSSDVTNETTKKRSIKLKKIEEENNH